MENKDLSARWISVITLFVVINCFVPVRCGSNCVSYSSYYYCYYYADTQYYYNHVEFIGRIVGGVVGGVAGLAIFMCSMTIMIVKVCKKTNHERTIVHPAQPPVFHINTAQNTSGESEGQRLAACQHDPNSTRLHHTPSIQVQPVIHGQEELHHFCQGQPSPVNQVQTTFPSQGDISPQDQGQLTFTNHGHTTSPNHGETLLQNQRELILAN
ncbi:uncharacterized protein LOC125653685 [Ostrea edulis]|uniref:uncharacterized protein LOC125653685 n=1 Tax=Ostrea edulis TaxID=37623 RepID=UPI0024AF5088|nr:uncharacterized protein LOC125653685 [Ostrea edulis]